VGIDVSKGKSTVAIRRPGGEIVMAHFRYTTPLQTWALLFQRCVVSAVKFGLSWSIPVCTGGQLPLR
jgi:hypothetical protein